MRYAIVLRRCSCRCGFPLSPTLLVLRGSQVMSRRASRTPPLRDSYVSRSGGLRSGSGIFAELVPAISTAYSPDATPPLKMKPVSSWTTLHNGWNARRRLRRRSLATTCNGITWSWVFELNYNRANFRSPPLIRSARTPQHGYLLRSHRDRRRHSRSPITQPRACAPPGRPTGRLPYGFIGLAVGRANAIRTSTVVGTATDWSRQSDLISSSTRSLTDKSSGVYAYGYTFGTGAEIAADAEIVPARRVRARLVPPLQGHQRQPRYRAGRGRLPVLAIHRPPAHGAPARAIFRLTPRRASLFAAAGHPSPPKGAHLEGWTT